MYKQTHPSVNESLHRFEKDCLTMAKRNDRKHCNILVKPGCADLRPAHFYLTRAREAGERTNTHLEASARVPHSAKNAREDQIYARKEQNKLGTSQNKR
jgi:hypothetical protein